MVGYGGDYNPEQWPEPVWAQDMALMRQAGVNLVTLGVFSWSSLEPAPGRYRWDWLDRALDLLHANDIRVILATPTASPPPWFSRLHPQALPVTAEGVRLHHGSRDTYCVHAPAYRAASAAIATALAGRYGHHPALAMWHVHNEYGTGCHCALADAAFRDWLARRYGDLAALNEAWTTAFWSQGYADWADVHTPRATRYLPNPTQALDYRRFLSGALREHYLAQRDLLRAASPGTPVTTNFAFGAWVPVDVWEWAADLDVVAIDCYPDTTGVAGAQEVAFAADLARGIARAAIRATGVAAPRLTPEPASAARGAAHPGAAAPDGPRGGRWMVMEQAADLVYTGGRMTARPPGELIRHSLAHLARGAEAVLHFQWRASPGGAELWHAAMLPHTGPQSPTFREVAALGQLLAGLPEHGADSGPAQVALVWDVQCWWALQGPGLPAADLDYLDGVRRVHSALDRLGVAVDIVAPGADLRGYPVVLVPGLYAVSDADAARLNDYPGTLVVWYFSGVVDERLRVRTGGHPGAFRDRLGLRVEQFQPQPPDTRIVLSTGAIASAWRETVVLQGAQAVARYPDGSPAITRHADAWYVSTRLDPAGLAGLLAEVLDSAEVARPAAPPPAGVELLRRGEQWIALNHTDEPATVVYPTGGQVTLPPGGYALG